MLLRDIVLFTSVVSAFVCGVAVAGARIAPSELTLLLLGAGATLIAISTQARRPLWWFLASLFAGLSWGALLGPPPEEVPRSTRLGGLARLTFEVERSSCGAEGCWSEGVLGRCEAVEEHACAATGVRVGIRSRDELAAGSTVTALGALRLRQAFQNPGPQAVWPDVRPPIAISLHAAAAPRVDHIGLVDRWLARGRQRLRASLDASLRAPHAGVARALLLGEGAAVDGPLNDAIRNAGVSHVLAVSGMHVTLLAGAFVWGMRHLWLRSPLALAFEARRAAAALGAVLAPLIARFCGSAPSAVRAAYTSALIYGLIALGHRPHPLAVTAFIVGIQAAMRPHDALHPGFVLSVLATVALLTQGRAERGLLAALRESLRAWLATAPFLVLCFGQVSLIAVAANVALLPLGSALVPVAAAHAAAAAVALDRELASAALFELADGAFLEAARRFSDLDPGVRVPPLTALELLACCALVGSWMVACSARARAVIALACCALIGSTEWLALRAVADDGLRVTFLDVGQGDSAIVESRGRVALIDAGGTVGGGPDPGLSAVVPALRARRIRRLDLVVLSHPHPDHYGGLFAVLDALPVTELWDTGQARAEGEGGMVAELLRKARERGVRVREPSDLCRTPQRLGAARLHVLSPCPRFDETLGANDNSFVIRLEHGARSLLFTGDIEEATELRLARTLVPADVLKVAHHGSRTSSTAPLLERVRPWLAIVSAGRANRFGHPHAEVTERLQSYAANVLRTDVHGGVELTSDGRSLRVVAWDPAIELRRE